MTGAAKPNNGGDAAGSRRMPLNHTMNAAAVPTRLRYVKPTTLRPVNDGGAPSIDEHQRQHDHSADQQLPAGRGDPVRGCRVALGQHDTDSEREVRADRRQQSDCVEPGAGVDRDERDSRRGDAADNQLAPARSAIGQQS